MLLSVVILIETNKDAYRESLCVCVDLFVSRMYHPAIGSHIVRMSKSGLVLAPMVTLKVLVNIRLGQNVPFSSITNLYFLNFSQKCHTGTSRWSGRPDWGWPWLPGRPRSSLQLIHRPSKILNRLSKTMHSAASLRKKGKTLSLPLHAHSKHMGRRKVLLRQGIS